MKTKKTKKTKKQTDHKCWWCEKPEANVCTEPSHPDEAEMWFHESCYWKFQGVLYD